MDTHNYIYKDKNGLVAFLNKLNNSIDDSGEVLVQIFSGVIDKILLQNIVKTILEQIPKANIIGTTTDGEIVDDLVLTNSIVISITDFKKTNISIDGEVFDSIESSFDVGKKLAKKLIKTNTKALILFGDGLHLNGEDFLNGVNSVIENKDIAVAGGLAGDNAKFKNTFTIFNNNISTNMCVGVSLNSDKLSVFNNYSFAWKEVGKEFVVEKSYKNIVYKIDGKTPLELYKEYLGDDIANSLPSTGMEFPLIIVNNKNLKVARAVLGKNSDGSLIFAGNINKGDRVKFGIGNSNIILKDSSNLAKSLENSTAQSIFIYSCMARRRFLETDANIDIKFFNQLVTVSGFFTYGEFYTKDKKLNLLNETLTLIGFSENNTKIDKKIDIDIKYSNISTLKALSNLINKTSLEYEDLNKKLEIRVKEEVEKNLKANRQIFESMKMSILGEMIGNIAHQWRQPLSVITTGASAIKLNKELGLDYEKNLDSFLDTAISQAQYLSETIDTFRNFIREKSVLRELVLEDEIKKGIKISETTLKKYKIDLIDNIDYSKHTMVKIVSSELPQVIINIINNAKDAIDENNIENRWIKIDLKTDNKYAIIYIEDSGGGIPENIIDKIFEPYFTTKNKKHGTGIGLYMSYDIICNHFNGDLSVKNTENGAKFSIKIPLFKY